MSRWPFLIVTALVLFPVLLTTAVGSWALWTTGHWRWLPWTIPVCWAAAWLVVRYSRRIEAPLPEIGSEVHWTPRDHAAMEIVKKDISELPELSGEQLIDPKFYAERTKSLAIAVAHHYHPRAKNPLDSASVIELLTVLQLVAEDMERLLQENVPGSHLITVAQWKSLANAPAWWRAASNVGWVASVFFNPTKIATTFARYALLRSFSEPVSKVVQTNILGAFYAIYLRQLGYYLIELNSGRLRGGTIRYRDVMRRMEGGKKAAGVSDSESQVEEAHQPVVVTIAVIGQVKAGKSSLVNCLLGEQRAAVDILPLTNSVRRYELHDDARSDRLILLDTPGYNDSGATDLQIRETWEAVKDADLVLLVMEARSPAKQADTAIMEQLAAWFRNQHRLKPPAIIGVVSKVDQLSPVMEWSPPYSWEHPQRPKEVTIRAAVDYVRQTFGDRLETVLPVCTDRENGRVFGVEEYLMPALSLLLDSARAVALVRAIHSEYDQQRAGQVVSQLMAAGNKIRDYLPGFAKAQLGQAAKQLFSTVFKK